MKNEKPISNDIAPYLNEIANHLWLNHASVMIGSGFSKNAIKTNTDVKDFPLWNDLGDIFFEKLYNKKPGKNQKYLDVLKLAGEIQATFGRATLNQILLSEIQDDQYKPSALHEELLKLPWNDVFTTNYDTLLERTAEKIKYKQYRPIVNKTDLVWSSKPRIIKLHGSFPSNKPFIITEEDYRTYPDLFAPFVNTVQQSLIENILCLIGFSGTDPNFLSWIGWIRDNLGKDDSLRMFLIGILNLPIGQRKLLETRNIIPIDLSLLPVNYNKNHYDALIYFIKFLNDIGKQKNWGDKLSSDDRQPEEADKKNIKQITNVNNNNISPKMNEDIYKTDDEHWLKNERYIDVDFSKNDPNTYKELIKNWKIIRKNYPNWVILPHEFRDRLKQYTGYIHALIPQDLTHPFDIEYLFEFNWRNEKCLYSYMSDEWITFYESIINRYNPFPTELLIDDEYTITPVNTSEMHLNWVDISTYWIEIQLSLLSLYRRIGIENKWQVVVKKLDKVKKYFSPEQLAKYHYEMCLFAIFSFDITSIKMELASWECNLSLPFWEAKRAGIMAEFGDLTGAISVLEQALISIRKKLTNSSTDNDYFLLSQEGHILQLLKFIKGGADFIIKDFSYDKDELKRYNERLALLRQLKCDPFEGIEHFSSYLKSIPSTYYGELKKFEFEINNFRIYKNNGINDIHTKNALSLLIFFEELGMPFRLLNFYYDKDTINNAITIISQFYLNWAIVSSIRQGDKDNINSVINRKVIAFLSQENTDNFIDYYLSILMKIENEIYQKDKRYNITFLISLGNIILDILARLCVKCSHKLRKRVLDFVEKLYNVYNANNKYNRMEYLIQYLIQSFSVIELYELLPQLLQFPIILQEKYSRDNYVDPFSIDLFLENQTITIIRQQKKIEIDNIIIDNMISCLSDINGKRKTAFMRLSLLYHYNLLSDIQINEFSRKLWEYRDNSGFPDDTNYYHFAFLELPHPKEIIPEKIIDEYILKTFFPIQGYEKSKGIPFTGGYFPIFQNIIGLANESINYAWDKEKINLLVNRIIEWWNIDKKYLISDDSNYTINEFKARFNNIINIFINVFSPNIKLIDKEIIPILKLLLDEFHNYSIPDIASKIVFIEFYPENDDELIQKLLLKFKSKEEDSIIDSINAIRVLLKKNHKTLTKFVKTLSEIIKYRTNIYLNRYINLMIHILRKYSNLVTEDILNDIFVGLEYLIKETTITINDNDEEVNKKLLYRNSCSELACLLKYYLIKNNKNIHECVLLWENICLDENEFSEIRTTWKNCELENKILKYGYTDK
jgi:hypothetical protein